MLRWIIVLAMLSLLFSACDKCKLKESHTLNLSYSQPFVSSSGLWTNTPAALIVSDYFTCLDGQFAEPDQLQQVIAGAEYYVTIDSLFCSSGQQVKTVQDPCWESQGFIMDLIFPATHQTFTLQNCTLRVAFTIHDSLNNIEEKFSCNGIASQYLYQPTGDSTQCFQYELEGTAEPAGSNNLAAREAYREFKCIIRKWLKKK